MSELGRDARELIERALRDEASVDAVELARIRRRVLAAGAGASVFGSVGKAIALLGKASVGPVIKAFGLGVAVTVLALGIPTVLSKEHANPQVSQPTRAAVVVPKPALEIKQALPEEAIPAAPSLPPPHAAMLAIPVAPPSPQRTRPPVEPTQPSAPLAAPPAIEANALSQPSTPPDVRSAAGSSETYSTPTSAPPRKASTLVQELTLLEKVQSELRAGHGAAALRLLDRSTPPEGGQLQAERLAAEVFAACQAGDVARARASARLFLSRYASSPASARVRSSCAGEQVENAP